MQADLYFFSAVTFSLSNWDKFGHVFAYRAISRGRFRTEKALTSFKSSTSFTIDFPVIAVNFLPILRPVRQKSRFYFFVMCLLIKKISFIGFVLIFFVSGVFNRAALSKNHLSIDQRSLMKGKMSAVSAKLSVNGCAEIENLLAFCKVPTERICVGEEKEFASNEV